MDNQPHQLIIPASAQTERSVHVPRTHHDISWSVVVKAIAAAVGAYAAIYLLGVVVPILVLLLESALLACALTPPVHWLMRHGVHRGLAAVIVLGGVAGVIALTVALITPSVIDEGTSTAAALPGYVNDAQVVLARFPTLNEQIQKGANSGSADPSAILPYFFSSSGSVISGLSDVIAVIFISAYFLTGGERSLSYIEHYFSDSFRHKFRRASPGIIKVVSGYVFGQAATSLLFGLFTLVSLSILGVGQPVLLAILAAILDAIPLVGTLIATAIAVLLALTVSPTVAIIVLILFLAYNVIESNVILPNVYGRAMGISSLAVLVAVLVGYRTLGLVGVLIALPVAA